MQDFRNLEVWHKAHTLTLAVFEISNDLARPPYFGFRNQLLRAAVSIPANIAEGCGRTGDRDFPRFVRLALGSASELEYHLLLARDLGLLTDPVYERLSTAVTEVKRMLTGLIARLSASIREQGSPTT